MSSLSLPAATDEKVYGFHLHLFSQWAKKTVWKKPIQYIPLQEYERRSKSVVSLGESSSASVAAVAHSREGGGGGGAGFKRRREKKFCTANAPPFKQDIAELRVRAGGGEIRSSFSDLFMGSLNHNFWMIWLRKNYSIFCMAKL